MNSDHLRIFTSSCLVVGGILGMVGSFSSPSIRGIAWGLDGTALIISTALLAVYQIKKGNELSAAGFLVFVTGQTLVVAGSAMELTASSPLFGAGVGLWAAALTIVSSSSQIPIFVRITGFIASLLFAVTALEIYGGLALTPLSKPLPFFAYPFLVLTLFGWAWIRFRSNEKDVI